MNLWCKSRIKNVHKIYAFYVFYRFKMFMSKLANQQKKIDINDLFALHQIIYGIQIF